MSEISLAESVASPEAAYLRLRGLTKRFGQRTVLESIYLDVEKGSLLGLLGPSGSGKSTILNIIGGFVVPESGSIEIGGEDILDLPPHRRDLGITFQSYALFPHLTVFDNVAYGLVQRRIEKEEIRERVHEMLTLVSLVGYENRYPRHLSGGEQQRVALARALAIRPRLMLLDEPLANLDANLRQRVRFEIREVLHQTNVTSIFVTHDQDEAFALCDRVAVPHEGRIRQVGPPVDIIREPADSSVAGFLGSPSSFEGVVVRASGDEVTVKTNAFESLAICRSRPALGTKVTTFIRPEEVRIEPVESTCQSAVFHVRDSIFLGNGREIWLEGPVSLRCRVAMDDERFSSGVAVRVGWPAKSARAFAAVK